LTTTPTGTTQSATIFTQWESKTLASDMFFENSISGKINGKNYLFCNATYGGNSSQDNIYVTIVILDITNPDNPIEISSLQIGPDSPSYVGKLKLSGSTLYVITLHNFWIIDVSNPNQPKNVGQMPFTGNVEISGKYAYIERDNPANVPIVNTFDISDPVHPVSVGQLTIPNVAFSTMEASGSLLLALADSGLYIYDISRPTSLKQVGFLANPFSAPIIPLPESIPESFFDMALSGKDLYITAGVNKLLVVDISNPSAPKIVNDFETREQDTQIIVSGKLAYMLASNGVGDFPLGNLLAVVDISDPANLKELNSIPLPGLSNDAYLTDYYFMSEANNRLHFSYDFAPLFQIISLSKSPWN
jgi:hypothetical protein